MANLRLPVADPSSYGQVRLFDPTTQPWAVNEARGVLSWTGLQRYGRDPTSRSVLLALDYVPPTGILDDASHVWRWQISASVGGVRRTFKIDAGGAQIIGLPVDGLDISLLIEENPAATSVGLPTFAPPSYPVTASAYHAVMPSANRSATYSMFQDIPATVAGGFFVPAGAVAWRPLGHSQTSPFLTPGYTSPFSSTIWWSTNTRGAGVSWESWRGTSLDTGIHGADGYLPLAQPVNRVLCFNNSASPTVAGVQFAIDF